MTWKKPESRARVNGCGSGCTFDDEMGQKQCRGVGGRKEGFPSSTALNSTRKESEWRSPDGLSCRVRAAQLDPHLRQIRSVREPWRTLKLSPRTCSS